MPGWLLTLKRQPAVLSLLRGLGLTWMHLRRLARRRTPQSVAQAGYFAQQDGPVTIQYPRERIPAPDVGRYRLHVEIDDCIGCDQCARVCPVDCIDIVKIKATEHLPPARDGSKVMFHYPVFDIDHAKCCFCGLCTVVCPTECITMTKVYDFSTQERTGLNYHFGNMDQATATVKEAEAKAAEEARKAAKAAALAAAQAQKEKPASADPSPAPTA